MNDIKKQQEELTEEQLQQVTGGCKSKHFDKTIEFKELTEQEQDACGSTSTRNYAYYR